MRCELGASGSSVALLASLPAAQANATESAPIVIRRPCEHSARHSAERCIKAVDYHF